MLIERHIFGSYKGYTTLARSPGVSTDDSRILESFAYNFGQTYDARFNKTLAGTPAFFTLALRGGRRALARVLEGAPDDNNRPTLRVVTVIVSRQDWDSQLCGDVQILLEEERLWQWDGSAQPAAIEVTFRPPSHSVPRKSVPRVLALLSEIERGHAAHRGVVVSANEFSQQEIACLEILVPPSARAEFTSAYRTLSPQLQATVNCLAVEAGSQDRVTFRFQPEHTPLSPYAEYLHDSGFASGSIPLERIMAYNRFGMPPVQPPSEVKDTPVPLVPVTVVQRAQTWPLFAVALMAVILCIGAFVAAVLLGSNATDRLQNDIISLRRDNAATAAMIEELKQASKKAEQDLGTRINDVRNMATAQMTGNIETRIAAQEDTENLRRDIKKAKAQLKLTQRAHFTLLQQDLTVILQKPIRDAIRDLQRLKSLFKQCEEFLDDWEFGSDSDKEFLKTNRPIICDLAKSGETLKSLDSFLHKCDEKRQAFTGLKEDKDRLKAVGEIQDLVKTMQEQLEELPDKVGEVELKDEKADFRNKINEFKRWMKNNRPKKKGNVRK